MAVCFATYNYGDSVAYFGKPAEVDALATELRRQARGAGCGPRNIRVTHADLTSRDCEGYICKPC